MSACNPSPLPPNPHVLNDAYECTHILQKDKKKKKDKDREKKKKSKVYSAIFSSCDCPVLDLKFGLPRET